MACESFVEHLVVPLYFLQRTLFLRFSKNLNVIGHLPVPAGWGSCLPRLAIFFLLQSNTLVSYEIYIINIIIKVSVYFVQ